MTAPIRTILPGKYKATSDIPIYVQSLGETVIPRNISVELTKVTNLGKTWYETPYWGYQVASMGVRYFNPFYFEFPKAEPVQAKTIKVIGHLMSGLLNPGWRYMISVDDYAKIEIGTIVIDKIGNEATVTSKVLEYGHAIMRVKTYSNSWGIEDYPTLTIATVAPFYYKAAAYKSKDKEQPTWKEYGSGDNKYLVVGFDPYDRVVTTDMKWTDEDMIKFAHSCSFASTEKMIRQRLESLKSVESIKSKTI